MYIFVSKKKKKIVYRISGPSKFLRAVKETDHGVNSLLYDGGHKRVLTKIKGASFAEPKVQRPE